MHNNKYKIYQVNANANYDNFILDSLESLNGYDFLSNIILCFTRRRVRNLEKQFIEQKILDNKAVMPPTIATLYDYVVRNSDIKLIPEIEAKYLLIQALQETEHKIYRLKMPELADEILGYYQSLLEYYPENPIEVSLEMLVQKISEIYSEFFLSEIIKDRLDLLIKIITTFHKKLQERGVAPVSAAAHELKLDAPIGLLIVDAGLILYPLDYYVLNALIAKAEKGILFIMKAEGSGNEPQEIISRFPAIAHKKEKYIIEEFDESRQKNLIKKATSVFLTARKEDNEIVSMLATREDELRYIANKIHELALKGVPLDSISIIFPDPYKYIPAVKRIFSNYRIDFNYAFGERILNETPIQTAYNVLKLMEEDYARDIFLFILNNKYVFIPDAECIIQEIKNSSIIYGSEYWQSAEGKAGDIVKIMMELVTSCSTMREYLSGYIKVLRRLNYGNVQGLNEKEKTIIEDFWDLLHSLQALSCDMKISFNEFKRIIGYLLTQKRYFGIEKLPKGVSITGIVESMNIHSEVIFFAGLIDGDEPKVKEWLMLPDEFHKLAGIPTVDDLINEQKLYFNYVMNSGAQLIYLSYPQLEADSKNLCSMFIREYLENNSWNKTELSDNVLFSWEEHLINKGECESIRLDKYYEAPHLSDASIHVVNNLYSPDKAISITNLSLYYDCPQAFYLQNVLRLQQDEEPSFDFNAKEWGILIHEILCEAFSQKGNWEKIALKKFKETIKAMPEPIRLFYMKRFRLDIAFLKYFQKTMMSEYHPVQTELSISEAVKDDDFSQMLKGKIDRVDKNVDKESYAIIDYKTGNIDDKKYKLLQLPLYSILYNKKFSEMPDKMLLVSLMGAKSRYLDVLNRKNIDEVIDDALAETKRIMTNIRAGIFFNPDEQDVDSRDATRCRYCPFSYFC